MSGGVDCDCDVNALHRLGVSEVYAWHVCFDSPIILSHFLHHFIGYVIKRLRMVTHALLTSGARRVVPWLRTGSPTKAKSRGPLISTIHMQPFLIPLTVNAHHARTHILVCKDTCTRIYTHIRTPTDISLVTTLNREMYTTTHIWVCSPVAETYHTLQ